VENQLQSLESAREAERAPKSAMNLKSLQVLITVID